MPQMLMPGSSDGRYSLNAMIFLSFVFHLLVLSFFFFSPSRSAPRWTFGPVYSVQLVGSSEIASREKGYSLPIGERKEPLSKDLTTVTKSLPERLSPLPLGKVLRRKDRKDSVEKAVESIRTRVRESKPAVPARSKGSGSVPPVASPAGRPGGAEGRVKMDAYYAVIWSLIRSQWAMPGGIVPRGNSEAIVHVRILRSGAVTELRFEKRSGNRYFDESAMRAIQKASPFPPFPELGGGGESIELGIRFHPSELR